MDLEAGRRAATNLLGGGGTLAGGQARVGAAARLGGDFGCGLGSGSAVVSVAGARSMARRLRWCGELGRRSSGAGMGTVGFSGAVAISVRSRRKEPDGCGYTRVPNAIEKKTKEES